MSLGDGRVRVGVPRRIRIGDGDASDACVRDLAGFGVGAQVVHRIFAVRIAMAPAIDRDGRNIGIGVEAAGREDAGQFAALLGYRPEAGNAATGS
jgi:hypothetical protein